MPTPKMPGYQQPPQERYKYECYTGGDLYGQMPPTEAQPISQRKQLAGDPAGGRMRMRSRQFNRGGGY